MCGDDESDSKKQVHQILGSQDPGRGRRRGKPGEEDQKGSECTSEGMRDGGASEDKHSQGRRGRQRRKETKR